MAGKSPREKAAEELYKELSSFNPNVRNRFDTPYTPFSYEQMYSNLKDIFGNYRGMIDRDTAEQIANEQQKAAESFASRGITGGSILTDTQAKLGSALNRAKINALSNLANMEATSVGDLQKYFNQLDFINRQAAQNVDLANVQNRFNLYGLRGNAMQGLDNTTWLDDVISMVGENAKIFAAVAPFIFPPAGAVAGMTAGMAAAMGGNSKKP